MEQVAKSGNVVLQAIKVDEGAFELRTVVLDDVPVSERLRIYVVFTTVRGTQAALSCATAISAGLDADLALVVPQVVPFPLSLDRPPISPAFTFRKLMQLAAAVGIAPYLYICLCRDPLEGLVRMLPKHVPVLCGVRHRRLFRSSERLALGLRRFGCDVIQVTYR